MTNAYPPLIVSASKRYGSFFALAGHAESATAQIFAVGGAIPTLLRLDPTPDPEPAEESVTAMAFNRREDVLACVYDTNTVILWDLQHSRALLKLSCFCTERLLTCVFQVAFHPSDMVIATLHPGAVALWDLQSLDMLAICEIPEICFSESKLLISSDGKWLVTCGKCSHSSQQPAISVWELDSAASAYNIDSNYTELIEPNRSNAVTALALDQHRPLLAVGWCFGLAEIIDLEDRSSIPLCMPSSIFETLFNHEKFCFDVQAMCFVPRLNILAVAYLRGLVFWDYQYKGRVEFVHFLPLQIGLEPYTKHPSSHITCDLTTQRHSHFLVLIISSFDKVITWRIDLTTILDEKRLISSSRDSQPPVEQMDDPALQEEHVKPPSPTETTDEDASWNLALMARKHTRQRLPFHVMQMQYNAKIQDPLEGIDLSLVSMGELISALKINPVCFCDSVANDHMNEDYLRNIDNFAELCSSIQSCLPELFGLRLIKMLRFIKRLASKHAEPAYLSKLAPIQGLLSAMAKQPDETGLLSRKILKKLARQLN